MLSEGSPCPSVRLCGFNQTAEIALTDLPILLKNPTHHQVHIVCGSQRVTSVPGIFAKAQERIIVVSDCIGWRGPGGRREGWRQCVPG